MEFASDIRRKKRTMELRQRVRSSNPLGQEMLPRRLPFATSTPPSDGARNFYGQQSNLRECADTDGYWQPGDVLPITPQMPRSQVQDSPTVMDVLQGFQASMEKQLSTIGGKLEDIHERMDTLESRQIALEKEVKDKPCKSTTKSTPSSASGKRRKRITPTALQHARLFRRETMKQQLALSLNANKLRITGKSKIRAVHAVFDEEDQIKVSEPITSDHNSKVVKEIIKSIGCDKFDEDQIRKGCQTYRRTLVERTKEVSPSVKKKKQDRSRKQRSYERRGKVAKDGKEAKMWADVTPEMMSDEELDSTGKVYVRHPPSYRSDVLNKFISLLDSRLNLESKAAHPRMERILGSPTEKTVPKQIQKWIVKNNQDENTIPVAAGTTECLTPCLEQSDIENDSSGSSSDSDSSIHRIIQQYK